MPTRKSVIINIQFLLLKYHNTLDERTSCNHRRTPSRCPLHSQAV